MAWGMFFAVPCPYRVWDQNRRIGMLLCLPLIGGLTGSLWVIAAWLLNRFFCPRMVGAVVLAILPGVLTGMIHLDGFMDCCDAIFSRRDLPERQRILKDSHCGSFAVISLLFVFLLELSLLAEADLSHRLAFLIWIPAVSRLCSVCAICLTTPMPGSSYAGTFQKLLCPWHGRFAVCLLLGCCMVPPVLWGISGLSAPLTAAGSLLAITRGRRQLGGMSGDISGFGIVCGELCGIAAVALL